MTEDEHEVWRQNRLEENRKLSRKLELGSISPDYYCSWCGEIPEECTCLNLKPCSDLENNCIKRITNDSCLY